MKPASLLFLLLLLFTTGLQAQHEKDNWYFGSKVALNFPNSGTPVEFPNTCRIDSFGTSSTSVSHKTTGQLLFYTNGMKVWNRNNQVMDNGDKLLSSVECDYVLSVPNPADTSQYYIFMANKIDFTYQLRYAIVDMSLNGGLGKVINTDKLLAPKILNKFTVAKHGTSNAYWLITFRGSNGNDTFECYPITNAGIQPPIVSIMGTNKGVTDLGGMITNFAGDKIVITLYSVANGAVNIYNFSKNCGSVSTPKQLSIQPGFGYPRGPAFSPNDQNLYVTFASASYPIVQYSGPDFQNAMTVATASNGNAFLDMETGPDGKIYISTYQSSSGILSNRIDAIENPNLDAFSVAYKPQAILLTNAVVNYYLPNFITDNSTPGSAPANPVIDIKNTCLHDTTLFTPSNMPFLDSLVWDFGDTAAVKAKSSSTKDVPTHIYSDTGNYKVTLSWYNCGIKQSAFKPVQIITVPQVDLGKDTILCADDEIQLITGLKNIQLSWSTGATDSAITITKPGTYWLKVSAEPRCTSSDTVEIKYYPKLTVDFFDSTYIICEDVGETIDLKAGEGFTAYNWQPGNGTGKVLKASKTGVYTITVTNSKGCTANDTVVVGSLCDNTFFIPNAFTPDGDGLNDTFAPVFTDIFNYRMQIFNRWGEIVFESKDAKHGWDGTFKGKPAEEGQYTWKIFFQGDLQKIVRNYNYKGTVYLLK